MDLERIRAYPVIGDLFFSKPTGGRYAWGFLLFSIGYTGLVAWDRGLRVGLLAGGSLVLLSAPFVFPEDWFLASVLLRFVGILAFVSLWIGILVFFPDAPTFFAGNW